MGLTEKIGGVLLFINSGFAPLNNGESGVVKAPIGVKGVNRDSYIILNRKYLHDYPNL